MDNYIKGINIIVPTYKAEKIYYKPFKFFKKSNIRL